MQNSKSILLIEDNKHDQYFFSQAVKEIESASLYHVANNGRDALDKLQSSVDLPDFIFTDINMPVMDGVQCLTEIIKDPKIKDIPLVVLSTDTSRIGLLNEMGVKVFIEKPADFNDLTKLIKYVLSMQFMTTRSTRNTKLKTILSHSN